MKLSVRAITNELAKPLNDQEDFLYTAYIETQSVSHPANADLSRWRAAGKKTAQKAAIVREMVFKLLIAEVEAIHELICIKLRYCEIMNSPTADAVLEICLFLAERNIGSHEFGSDSPLKLGVYAVRAHLLDQICDC